MIVLVKQIVIWRHNHRHQIAAAIGQRFLFPDVYRKVVELLPKAAHGNLSYIAAWADQIKYKNEYRFTSPMHYTNPTPLIDNPPSHCGFDWNPGKIDLITAIHNYTKRLDPESDLSFWSRAEALRFLVHFIGDLHQPLHLTGKAKGGNGLHAIFEGHKTSVHYVWDSSILYKRIREFNENSTFDPNFTEDDSRFNSSDPLSGECNEDFKLSADLPLSSPNQLYFSSTNESSDHFSLLMNQKISFSAACPEFWAAPINKLNCQVTLNGYDPNLDLSIGEYYERIVNWKVIEKLLAISGFRIAAILNTILK
ncbi:38735_t:CDS:2 [Gigaspora margarita]|uniref:38735_t:CDS:1 n=1 Tax=Gigaspora margarita TaxID=4874 RepID=A0ABN7UK34_GIGMA|nr:38735_t:CDS:2 [Gigaspora margarita]